MFYFFVLILSASGTTYDSYGSSAVGKHDESCMLQKAAVLQVEQVVVKMEAVASDNPMAQQREHQKGNRAAGDGAGSCPSDWTDAMHFDCQLYVGARWCDTDTASGEGYGWCEASRKCDKTPVHRGGYALTGNQRWGWGDFRHFKDSQHPLTAAQVCSGCGADCPAIAPRRTLNSIPASCMDYSAATGQIWRDSSGYTCGAYHHGGFCIQDESGAWVPGELMEGYGALTTYRHWARKGTRNRKMHSLQACCTCGGGCDCTNGWKPLSGSVCVREFVYRGKAYSGCTLVDSHGGVAWCSHNEQFQDGQWSECRKCAAGWKQALGSACASEFAYKGKTYSGCTMVDHVGGKAWCAHNARFSAGQWSECVRCQ